jgi:HEAT repeat protein
MPSAALARVGQAHLDRFVAEVTSRHAEDSLDVLWAIWNMRGIPADRVAPILLKAMQTTTGTHPEETRNAAINALAVHPHPSAVEPVIAALEDPEPIVRFAAVRALRVYQDRRAIEPLRAYVRNPENRSQAPGGVAQALEAIGEIERGR